MPMGVVLISPNATCLKCGGKLLLRSDRPSSITLYTDDLGTVLATQFRKYCQNSRKGCSFTQHYSFHSTTEDCNTDVVYDVNWAATCIEQQNRFQYEVYGKTRYRNFAWSNII